MTKQELEALVEAQKKTIAELQNQLKFKTTLELNDNPDELICRVQLELLNKESSKRELTMEETKKVEIFTKLLLELSRREKPLENEATQLSDDELLEGVISIKDGNKKAN